MKKTPIEQIKHQIFRDMILRTNDIDLINRFVKKELTKEKEIEKREKMGEKND